MNLGIVVLYVQDLQKSKDFYVNGMDMTPVDAISGPTFLTLRPSAGSMISLQDKAAAKFAPGLESQPGTMELSFEVDDIDATWQRWHDLGVELLGEPVDLGWGKYFMAKDPDGHYLSAYRFNR